MTYTEIFDEVVSIMKTDSATCRDIPGDDPAPYRAKIAPDMPEEEFIRLVQDYLISFGFRGHLEFFSEKRIKEAGRIPVAVERYGNALYVTKAAEDSAFVPGDRIVALDGLGIEDAAEKYKKYLCGEAPERQGFYWGFLLGSVSSYTVIRKADGKREELALTRSTAPFRQREFEFRMLEEDIAYLYLPHFSKKDCVKELISPHKKELRRAGALIIDVRGNVGGNSGEYVCLFPYCFPQGKKEYPIYDCAVCETNYTQRNCALKSKAMEEYGMSPRSVENCRNKSGQGFVSEFDSPYGKVRGRKTPEKIVILTDSRCASSGDSLVAQMRVSPKVTVIGRPTAGANDYTECCMQELGEFTLQYPIKRSLLIDRGEGRMHKGEPVDILIPWTPEHIERDVDLERAMEMLKS